MFAIWHTSHRSGVPQVPRRVEMVGAWPIEEHTSDGVLDFKPPTIVPDMDSANRHAKHIMTQILEAGGKHVERDQLLNGGVVHTYTMPDRTTHVVIIDYIDDDDNDDDNPDDTPDTIERGTN